MNVILQADAVFRTSLPCPAVVKVLQILFAVITRRPMFLYNHWSGIRACDLLCCPANYEHDCSASVQFVFN